MENKFDMYFKIILLLFLGIIAISLVYIVFELSNISSKIFDLTDVIISVSGNGG